MKKTIFKNRVIKPKDFLGKKFKPSLQTSVFFTKLFTSVFPAFSSLIEIKSIEWINDKFNIIIIDKLSWEILPLNIKDNLWEKKCGSLLCTNNICMWVHSEIQNESFLKFLVFFLVKWSDLIFDELLKILSIDIKAKKEYYQIFWKAERPPFSIIQNWNHPLQKYRFLIHEGVFRNLDQSISLNLPEASISHAERECKGISPNNKNKGYHFFNFPSWFYDHSFDKYFYLTDDEKKQYLSWKNEWNSIGLFTDLSEEDIVMWKGTDKLSEAVKYIQDNIEKNNTKVISFNCCCVPRIVWDDIFSVLKKAKDKIDIPFILQWQLEKTPFEQKIELLEKYLDDIDKNKLEKIPKSISIFWFHENIYQKNLLEELNKLWVKINTSFLPTIDVRLLPLMLKSELFVFSPNNFQKEIFEYPFQSLWVDYILPVYPYSIKYTDEWISSIWEKLGIKVSKDLLWESYKDMYKNKVEYVKSKSYTVWIFLIGKKEVEKFINSDYMNNVDIINFLDEMWFNTEIYVYDNFTNNNRNDNDYTKQDWNHEEIKEIIWLKNKKVKIWFFSDEKSFEKKFKESKFDLIYSDLYFDNRIIERWLNQINLKNFFVWYKGALDTINWLINLCEMKFYKNYSKYFNK